MQHDVWIDERGVVHCASLEVAMRDLASGLHWRIVAALAVHSRSVCELAAELSVRQSTVSKSLDRLRHYELVDYECKKNEHVYSLRPVLKGQWQPPWLVIRLATEHDRCQSDEAGATGLAIELFCP